jgi:hypothetical protein
MKFLTKVSAGFFLSLGFVCLMATASKVSDSTDKSLTADQQHEARFDAMMGIGFSVPMLAGGSLMLFGLRQRNQKQLSDRLHSTFCRVLKSDKGRITVLRFAMEAQLTGSQAKLYLDQKAKEFNATFETSDKGDISYHFDI